MNKTITTETPVDEVRIRLRCMSIAAMRQDEMIDAVKEGAELTEYVLAGNNGQFEITKSGSEDRQGRGTSAKEVGVRMDCIRHMHANYRKLHSLILPAHQMVLYALHGEVPKI